MFVDCINANDRVGLYSLGEGWLIPLTFKGERGSGKPERLMNEIAMAEKIGGQCVLYKSMVDATACLSTEDGKRGKWLVVLSDSVDLEDISGM